MDGIRQMVRLARPGHWIKNLFVLAPLVFARQVGDPASWGRALQAVGAFCLASSAIYALNDVLDRREDAAHPVKRGRPVASGAVSPLAALVLAAALAIGALAWAGALDGAAGLGGAFVACVAAYLVLMVGYSLGLKRLAILDVLILATGFILRAYAGGVVLQVEISHWLLLCTLTLCLFLGFAKRESERMALGAEAGATRAVAWSLYSERSLEHMMTVSAGLAIVTYMLYTVSPRTITYVGHHWMVVTVLPVVYAVFRFYGRAITGEVTGPVDMVRRDPAFVVALGVWLAMVAAVLFAI